MALAVAMVITNGNANRRQRRQIYFSF